MKSLLVGYDGSDQAREAARIAGRLGAALRAKVTVLTVGQMVSAVGTAVVPAVDERAFLPTAEDGAEVVRALGAEAGVRAELGEPAQRLIEVAAREGHDLVVVGHRGLGGIKGLVLGSVAKRASSDAPCPVLVVRGPAPEAIRQVLAAVDGSEHAQQALEAALVLAKVFHSRVTLLHVVFPPLLAGGRHGPELRRLRLATQHRAGVEALARARAACERAGIRCDSMQLEGQPGQVICSVARGGSYDLVAVGRRGLGRLARLVLGSVSDEVLANAGPLVLLAGERVHEHSDVQSELPEES